MTTKMDNRVTSTDGTRIAFDRSGTGPPVILVGGAMDDGSENAPLTEHLASRFTVLNYARRGRGASGDTQPYDVDREIEDLGALIEAAGGSAHVFGASSGGALALEAAAAGLAFEKLAVYEVPYGWPPHGFIQKVNGAVAAGQPGEAVAIFLRSAGGSETDVAGMRGSPYWPLLESFAPTLAYDAACMRGGQPSRERLGAIAQPVLVAIGSVSVPSREGMSELAPDFFERAAEIVSRCLVRAERQVVYGTGHMVEAGAIGPVLTRFFAGGRNERNSS